MSEYAEGGRIGWHLNPKTQTLNTRPSNPNPVHVRIRRWGTNRLADLPREPGEGHVSSNKLAKARRAVYQPSYFGVAGMGSWGHNRVTARELCRVLQGDALIPKP